MRLPCEPGPNNIVEKKTVYKYDENVNIDINVPTNEHEEVVRTEWINPPTVVGDYRSHSRSDHHSRSRRSSSSDTTHKAKSHRSRSQAPPPPPPFYPPAPAPQQSYYEERKTTFEERESLSPTSHHSSHHTRSPSHGGALVVQEREYRSDRDIQGEISRLEAERRALRLEREAEERRDLALRIRERPTDEYQMVEYREPRREVLEGVERERSPSRNVLRVEKDRKGRMALVRSSN